MLHRRLQPQVVEALRHEAAVVLLGPRQAGKTSLAWEVASKTPSVYLDLEAPIDRARLADPELYLREHEPELVILDEVQRLPELFATLRGLIDQGRRRGKKTGRFLLLGSASAGLLRQSETLAGRVTYLELAPFDVSEVPRDAHGRLWVRGGFPRSFLAESDAVSLQWRNDFVRTYLERDIPQLGPRIPATTLHRFWTMLSHAQGGILNAAQLARNLAVDGKTIARYLDLMLDLMLVRRLMPYSGNLNKRLVRSPKIFVRDSGVVHALLGIADMETLLGHPIVGASWEGFVIETLVNVAPLGTVPLFYRTAEGAEIDLVLEIPGKGRWAIEIKRGLLPRPDKGFFIACDDIQASRRFVVYSGAERYPLATDLDAISPGELQQILMNL